MSLDVDQLMEFCAYYSICSNTVSLPIFNASQQDEQKPVKHNGKANQKRKVEVIEHKRS